MSVSWHVCLVFTSCFSFNHFLVQAFFLGNASFFCKQASKLRLKSKLRSGQGKEAYSNLSALNTIHHRLKPLLDLSGQLTQELVAPLEQWVVRSPWQLLDS